MHPYIHAQKHPEKPAYIMASTGEPERLIPARMNCIVIPEPAKTPEVYIM